jgi:[ribosomal protein S5]-alanine N-acetyltransferase
MRIQSTRLELIAGDAEMLQADIHDHQKLSVLLDATVPETWPPPLLSDVRRYFTRMLRRSPEEIGWWIWYWVRTDGTSAGRTLIGNGGFHGGPSEDGTVNMGYSLLEEYWGNGYGTEGVRRLVEWAFSHEEVSRITAETFPDLFSSLRILEKNGFIYIGEGYEADAILLELRRETFEDPCASWDPSAMDPVNVKPFLNV